MKTKTTILLFFICVIITACSGTQQAPQINNDQTPVQNAQIAQPAPEVSSEQTNTTSFAAVSSDQGAAVVPATQTGTDTAVFNTPSFRARVGSASRRTIR